MATELIGFLIIAAAMFYVFFRWNMQKTKKEPEDLKSASADLCRQLETAGDQIIDRVESYVTQLEALIEKADERIHILDQKILRLEQIEQAVGKTQDLSLKREEDFLPDFAAVLSKAEEKAEKLNDEMPMWANAVHQEDSVNLGRGEGKIPQVVSPRNKRVFLLMDQGVSEDEISRETGISKGGLTLIREMYKASKGID
jgi:hypothetical protein